MIDLSSRSSTYTDNEEALLNGDNILFIKSIVQYPHGAVGDYICGIEMQYAVIVKLSVSSMPRKNCRIFK